MFYYKLELPTAYPTYPIPLMEMKKTDSGYICASPIPLGLPEATEQEWNNS